jgi:hypothetical protein
MYFPELEKHATKYPKLAEQLIQFDSYLHLRKERGQEGEPIVPSLVARALSISEVMALTLLHLADKAEILKPGYAVYCAESDFFLGNFSPPETMPTAIFCDYHDVLHLPEEYYVEIIFLFNCPPSIPAEKSKSSISSLMLC